MQHTRAIQERVEQKLREVIAKAEAAYGRKFNFPTVTYDTRGAVAGWANSSRWLIKLNGQLLMENTDDFIERTVPHEMAHLVTSVVFPETKGKRDIWGRVIKKRESHGADWQSVMVVMGVKDITRCHDYDTTNSKVVKSNSRQVPWFCPCGAELKLTPKVSAILRMNPNARYHKGCRGRTLFEKVGAAAPSVAPVAPRAPAPAPAKEPAAGSKLERCANLYAGYKHLGRGMIIAMFINEADCTPAGAATYYATLKKRYG